MKIAHGRILTMRALQVRVCVPKTVWDPGPDATESHMATDVWRLD